MKVSDEFGAIHRLYRQLSKRLRRQLLLALLATVVGAVAEIATIGAVIPFIGILIDPSRIVARHYFAAFGVAAESDPQTFALLATAIFAATAAGAAVVRIGVLWISMRFVYFVAKDFSLSIYRKMLYKAFSYHLEHNSSDIIAAMNKVQTLATGVILSLVLGFSASIISLSITACLIFVSPAISLSAFVGFGLVYLCFGLLIRRRLRQNSVVISQAYGAQIKAMQEGLGAIRDIILDGSQPVFLESFRTTENRLRAAQATNLIWTSSPRYIVESAGMIVISAIICGLVVTGHPLRAALPALGALVLGAQRMLPSIQLIYNGFIQIPGNWRVMTDVLALLEAPDGNSPASGAPLPFFHTLRLDGVGFHYGSAGLNVLEDVSLEIPKGSKVGVIGRTGCGKSTLMDLVMGLMLPSTGSIWIDEQVLDETSLPSWRQQVTHVPQAIFLIDGTIRDNIALGIEPHVINEARLIEAVGMARLADFIDGLPAKYETLVGERGVRLSGGQRQRIGIARALYKRASVLVFDEATSALDGETEMEIMSSISALGRDLTIFLIAHRLSTIESCDIVCRIDAGRIVDVGSFQDVVVRADVETG